MLNLKNSRRRGVPYNQFNFSLDTITAIHNYSEKSKTVDVTEKTVHCQEFYRSLYPEHNVSDAHYQYDTFSIPGTETDAVARGQNALKWYYIQNCLDNGGDTDLEAEGKKY